MSKAGERQRVKDACASRAEPRLEERVRERGWRPTRENRGMFEKHAEAARRRPIERPDARVSPCRTRSRRGE